MVNVSEATEFLMAEHEWMMQELGVDGELLDWRWAKRMLMIRWPQLGDEGASQVLQSVGWH